MLRFRDPKKIDFFEKVAQKNLLDNNDLLAPKAPSFKADFVEDEILPQQFPARELRAHLPRGKRVGCGGLTLTKF